MTLSGLEAATDELFPSNGKSSMAAALGVDGSTLWRYGHRGKIPGPVSAALTAWIILKREFDLGPPSVPCELRDIEELAEIVEPGIRRRSGLRGLEVAALVVFGPGWKSKISAALGVDYSTIWRQVTSGNVQGPVMASVRAWLVLKRIADMEPKFEELTPRKQKSSYAHLLLGGED